MLLKVINDWVDDTTEVSDLHITQKFSLTDIRKQSFFPCHFTFRFNHLADAFIQSDFQLGST